MVAASAGSRWGRNAVGHPRCAGRTLAPLSGELLAREAFDTLLEAKVSVARCRGHYNQVRPHSALGYRPPAPEAILPHPESLGPRPLQASTLTWRVVTSRGAGQGGWTDSANPGRNHGSP